MSDLEQDSTFQGIRPLLDECDNYDPGISAQISAKVQEIQGKNYLASEGAFTDVVTPSSTASPDVRRAAQALAATQEENAPISRSRRKFLRLIGNIFPATISAVAAEEIMNILLSEKTYDESFIREILRLDSNKLDLLGLRDKLLSSGKTKEARLITLILPAGESFDHTYESISELEHITRTSRLSKFSEVYLGRVLSHHYRYLGLHDCAKSIFSKYSEYESEDRRLNVYILNAKFMNRYKELYSHGSFAEELKGDSRRLADSYRKHFDADISSMDISAFREALSVSFQCAALKGLYLQNLCMTATTEKEALSALTEIDAYRKLVVQTLNIDEKRYQVIRSYGEALWWYGRVATIAFLKSWDRVVERCLASFYDSASITNQAEVNIFNDFHQSHKQSLRSPVWLQMALVCTMWNEVRRGDGQLVLTKLIAEENNYQFKHNVEVLRSYNALTVVFGRSPIEIPVSQALAQTEHGILLDCIRTMLKRRASL